MLTMLNVREYIYIYTQIYAWQDVNMYFPSPYTYRQHTYPFNLDRHSLTLDSPRRNSMNPLAVHPLNLNGKNHN